MRQPTLAVISCSLSVFMAKFWLVYQPAPPASSRQSTITARGPAAAKGDNAFDDHHGPG